MASYGTRYIKKKTPYGLYFALLVIFLIVGYFVSGLYNIPNVKLNNLQDSLLYCFMHPLSNWNEKTPAVMGAFFILWFMLLSYFMYYYRNFQNTTEDIIEPVITPANKFTKRVKPRGPKL